MTLQDLGNIGEFLGAAGVVISLIYLATQIRQNTRSVREAVIDSVSEGFIESLRIVSLNSEFAELLDAGNRNYTNLSDAQRRRYRYHYLANSLQFENLFRKYREGHLPDSQWESIVRVLRNTIVEPGMRQAWEHVRLLLGSEFQELVDEMVEEDARK